MKSDKNYEEIEKSSKIKNIIILILVILLVVLLVVVLSNYLAKPTVDDKDLEKENIISINEEIAVQENVVEENIEQENIVQDNVKHDNAKHENVKQDNIKQDNVKKENIKQECKNTYNTFYDEYQNYESINTLNLFKGFKFIDDNTKIKNNEMNTFYVRTNVKFDEFKTTVLNIVSNDFYNNKVAKYVKEKDGMLYMIPGGGFTASYLDLLKFDIVDLDNVNFNKVVIDVLEELRYDDGSPSSKSQGKITFVKEHNKYVIDKIDNELYF